MRYEGWPDIPVVEPSQYILMHAEVLTGIILTLTGERYIGHGDRYLIFDSLADAEQYAERMVTEDPSIECWVANYEGKGSKRIHGDLESVIKEPQPPLKKKRWWFWSR